LLFSCPGGADANNPDVVTPKPEFAGGAVGLDDPNID
jgi:hypothetical protein